MPQASFTFFNKKFSSGFYANFKAFTDTGPCLLEKFKQGGNLFSDI